MSRESTEAENENRWLILRNRVHEENIKAAFEMFRAGGIEPVLIKGWAAAREYPEMHRRVFSDIDLCVSPGTFEAAQELILREGEIRLNIDLHRGLRHLDTLEWDDLFENSRIVRLGDAEIRILRPEDHLRVLCVHWLTDGGAYKEKLLDIFYLLENHLEDFDWERCLGKLSETRRGWILKTIGVTRKFYNLETSRMPFASEVDSVPEWFIKALEKEWASGTKLVPLHTLLRNRREFWIQLKKRVPPNAVQATIEMEGRIDDSPRFYYQIGSFFLRLKPSIKRIYNSLKIYRRGRM